MAKLFTYYNLSYIEDPKEFLGLSPDKVKGNIITTLGKNIIVVIKVSNQKQVCSWTVLDKLLSKVVYDQLNDQYVGVFASNYIRCWKSEQTDLDKIKKMKFHKPIADLVYCKENEPAVVYADGTFDFLSAAIACRKESEATKNPILDPQLHQICDANIFPTSYGDILTYFVKNRESNQIDLIFVPMNGSQTAQRLPLDRQIPNITLTAYSIIEGDKYPSVLTIWSDSRIFVLPLKRAVSASESPGNFISMVNFLKTDNHLSVCSVSKDCIAIYGANNSQEGSSIVLYNTQFKVVKSKQFFKIYFNFSRIWRIDDSILLAIGQNLSVLSFKISKEVMADMVGSQIGCTPIEYICKDYINEEDDFNSYISGIDGKPTNDLINRQNGAVAEREKVQRFEPFDDFNEELKYRCSRNLHIEINESNQISDTHIALMSNFKASFFETKQIEILVNEFEFSGMSENEICEKIVPLMIKANLSNDLIVCLRRYVNIPEKIIVKILKYALAERENQKSSDSLLNVVLSYSFQAENIIPIIRTEIDFKCVVKVIQYLLDLAINERDLDDVLEEPCNASFGYDADMTILKWIGVIFDAHFQNIILSRDVHLLDLLKQWYDFVLNYKSENTSLDEVYSLLRNLVENKYVCKEKNYSKWYTIEEVNF